MKAEITERGLLLLSATTAAESHILDSWSEAKPRIANVGRQHECGTPHNLRSLAVSFDVQPRWRGEDVDKIVAAAKKHERETIGDKIMEAIKEAIKD